MNHYGLHHKKGLENEEVLFCFGYCYDFHFYSVSNVRLGNDDD
jgi:hypothetical protein